MWERFVQVTLLCGATNQLSTVEEPNKCVYTAIFKTPAVCDAAEAAKIKAELAAFTSDE
jgi:hypothetical protein